MTLRRSRLERLLDIRKVRLLIVVRDLARATRAAASNADIMARLGELSADMTIGTGAVVGYEAKAVAATRAALAAAGAQQAARAIAAEAQRAGFAGDLRHQRAATKVVRRAIDRGVGLAPVDR